MTGRLPGLLDCRGIMDELGVKRATAEKIMRSIARTEGVVAPDDIRKVFVRRSDVERWLAENTRKIA